jgi:hypothetical protein
MRMGIIMTRSYQLLLIAVLTLTVMATSARAQKATEMYIPVGKSPGLSGVHTAVGTIDSLDVLRGTMTVADSNQTYLVRFTDATKIYLDRSPAGQQNTAGKISDCRKYAVVEVKFRGNKVGDVAEWIKVRVDKQ